MPTNEKSARNWFWFVKQPYNWLITGGTFFQPVVLLIVRILMGWEFFQTGHGKLSNISHPIDFFRELGIPFPVFNAWFVSGLECFGGLLLLFGFLSRPIAFMLTIDMIVAYLAVPDDRVKFFHAFTDPDSFTAADPFIFLLASVLVLCFGPGIFSVDGLLKWLCFRKKTASAVNKPT